MGGLKVEQHIVSSETGRQRLTVEMVGYPSAKVMSCLHDMGWQIEVQPIPVNRYRDCQAYVVTLVDVPGMTVRLPS
jgi:hypothetical protein